MAGLMTAAQPAPDAMPEAMPTGDMAQASPQEQAMYNEIVARALLFIYDKKMLPKLVKHMRAEDPKEALAMTGAMVLSRLNAAAEKSGKDITGDVKLHAAGEIFENLAAIATAAQIYDFDNDQEAVDGAFYRAMDELRMMETQSGRVDKAAMQEDMKLLAQSEQDGSLQNLIGALSKGQK